MGFSGNNNKFVIKSRISIPLQGKKFRTIMPGGGQLTSNKNILPCRIQILFANIYQTIERNIFAVYKTPIICIKQNW